MTARVAVTQDYAMYPVIQFGLEPEYSGGKLHKRMHYRLLSTPVGVPLADFVDGEELLFNHRCS
jgi:hypothetical protein